jgi:hypothetical protein
VIGAEEIRYFEGEHFHVEVGLTFEHHG